MVDLAPDGATALRVMIEWAAEAPLLPGRTYGVARGEHTQPATIAPLHYRVDPATGQHVAARTLGRGEVGACDMELSGPLRLEPADRFEVRDLLDGAVLGSGTVEHPLRRSDNVRWQAVEIGKRERASRLQQRPAVLWLTGISAAGKSTIANLVEGELHRRGHHTYLLDGDNVRHGLNSDLGFTAADRVENIRRVAEVARLMADAGLIVIVSFISPFRAERAMARSLLEPGEFFEIWVDVPLEVAEARDPKGLYRKARSGQLINFTGIDSPYEPPENPELRLRTAELSPQEAAARVIETLTGAGRLASGVSPGSAPRR